MILTLFTPTYNRAYTLPRLYDSLLAQTCFDFEWLIIDDGSVDATADLVKTFQAQTRFPVRYVYKENGGKHTAHNLALEEARGDWFLCIDSDDMLTDTAVADILEIAKELPENTGIASYKRDLDGHLLGGPFREGCCFETIYRISVAHNGGEFSYAFPTAFARQFPFPVFPGERFVGECVVYDRMDREGQMYLLPKVTMDCEYQADGYSRNISKIMAGNPAGYCLFFMQRIDIAGSLKEKLSYIGRFWCFRWKASKAQVRYDGKHKALVCLCLPLGVFFYAYYKLVRGF